MGSDAVGDSPPASRSKLRADTGIVEQRRHGVELDDEYRARQQVAALQV
jgi:hypothetical protein